MDSQALEIQYGNSTIGKQSLGQLRRLKLQEILNGILVSDDAKIIYWLDKKKSKLDRAKLADAVGLDVKPVNLRQSFKADIEATELKLRQRHFITSDAKTTKQIADDNAKDFLAFLESRLSNDIYQWPTNNKNRIYHKKIWSFFLDQPIEDIKSAPTFFSKNITVKEKLADIDVMIANNEVKTTSYASETALDEMQDTMTSAAISKLKQQLKDVREQLASEREERKRFETNNHKLKNEIEQYKKREKSILSSNLASIKIAGAH